MVGRARRAQGLEDVHHHVDVLVGRLCTHLLPVVYAPDDGRKPRVRPTRELGDEQILTDFRYSNIKAQALTTPPYVRGRGRLSPRTTC